MKRSTRAKKRGCRPIAYVLSPDVRVPPMAEAHHDRAGERESRDMERGDGKRPADDGVLAERGHAPADESPERYGLEKGQSCLPHLLHLALPFIQACEALTIRPAPGPSTPAR